MIALIVGLAHDTSPFGYVFLCLDLLGSGEQAASGNAYIQEWT